MKFVFLHIPKTAGLSVRKALVSAFGEAAVCPAKFNDELRRYSIDELNRYSVLAGHFDWAMLDCVRGPKHVFTVLRDPRERMLSFYFYLRKSASRMSLQELSRPAQRGLHAALTLSPDDYFAGANGPLRGFLDQHYDNFYTYYLAGRQVRAQADLAPALRRGELTRERLADLARQNLRELDAVYTVDTLGTLFSAVRAVAPNRLPRDDSFRENVNRHVAPEDRVAQLRDLGATGRTFERLDAFCAMDTPLWQQVVHRMTSPSSA